MIRPHVLQRLVAILVLILAAVPVLPTAFAAASPGQPPTATEFVRFDDDDDDDDDDDVVELDQVDDDAPLPPAQAPAVEDDGGAGGDDDGGSSSDDSSDDIGDGGSDDGEDGGGNDDDNAPLAGRSGAIVDDDDDPSTDGYFANEAIIQLAAGSSIDGVNQRNGTRTIAAIDDRALYLIELPAGYDPERAEADLAEDDDVVWVELNYASEAPEGRPGYFFTSGGPADAEAESQYALDMLRVNEAHACGTGGGVVVAVLDTGVDADHVALRGRVLTRGVNVLAGTDDTSDRGNNLDDDGDGEIDEMVGHGTHVAGIVAQVAPGATILPITVLNSDGVGDAFFLADGIYQAVAGGADVINLSLSSTYDSRVVAEAVASAGEAGVPVIAAVGNAGRAEPLEYPAAVPGAIGVAATDEQDRKTEFSNYGQAVSISAPGEQIVSTLPGDRTAAWGGTSMATAFVSGAAALLVDGDAEPSFDEIRARLTGTADDISAANPDLDGQLGAGRLNAAAAVACA